MHPKLCFLTQIYLKYWNSDDWNSIFQEGLLRVVLDGGPSRLFSLADGKLLEEDLEVLKVCQIPLSVEKRFLSSNVKLAILLAILIRASLACCKEGNFKVVSWRALNFFEECFKLQFLGFIALFTRFINCGCTIWTNTGLLKSLRWNWFYCTSMWVFFFFFSLGVFHFWWRWASSRSGGKSFGTCPACNTVAWLWG